VSDEWILKIRKNKKDNYKKKYKPKNRKSINNNVFILLFLGVLFLGFYSEVSFFFLVFLFLFIFFLPPSNTMKRNKQQWQRDCERYLYICERWVAFATAHWQIIVALLYCALLLAYVNALCATTLGEDGKRGKWALARICLHVRWGTGIFGRAWQELVVKIGNSYLFDMYL
jgi:hypothetical protein